MKKRRVMRLLALLFALVLTGCGSTNTGAEESNAGVSEKEYYYVPTYEELALDIDYVSTSTMRDGILYMAGFSYDDDYMQQESRLYAYDAGSGTLTDIPLTLPPDSASLYQLTPGKDGTLSYLLSWYGSDYDLMTGSSEMTDTDTVKETASERAVTDSADEADEAAAVTADAMIEEDTAADGFDGDDSYLLDDAAYHQVLCTIQTDGTLVRSVDMTKQLDGSYIQCVCVDGDSNYYFPLDSEILITDASGQEKSRIDLGDNWISTMFTAPSGQVYAALYGGNGMEFHPVDATDTSLQNAITSENLGSSYDINYLGTEGDALLLRDTKSLFRYVVEKDERTEVLDWLDSDINADDVVAVSAFSDDQYLALTSSYNGESTDYTVVTLRKTKAADMPEKQEIVLGTLYGTDQTLRKDVIHFNQTNDSYHITVKTYDSDDYNDSLIQFNNDLTGSNPPDLIDVSYIGFDEYASKGVFEDLYPYFEKNGISKDDYLSNALSAYEMDGALYAISPSFQLATTIVKSSNYSARGWTLDEMLAFAKSGANSGSLMQYASKSSVLNYCLYSDLTSFIDWENGESHFDGTEFINILNFAAKFPEESNYDEDQDGIYSLLQSNRVLLMDCTIGSIQEYQMYAGLFDGEANFVGYPSSTRQGTLIQTSGNTFAISKSSGCKDGAFAFLSGLLSDEYQDDIALENGWGFPVKVSSVQKMYDEAMEVEYTTDENGNQIEANKGSWGYDDFNIDLYAATQEEIDGFDTLLQNAVPAGSNSVNEEIQNIISEETGAFFDGQKTAEATADVIQNRVQIYMKENS